MIRFSCRIFHTLLFTFFLSCVAVELSPTIVQVSDGGVTTISLSNYNTSSREDQAFTQLITIDENTNFLINVKEIPSKVFFVIVQVHAYIYNVSMSYVKNIADRPPGKYVIGTNIGLIFQTNTTDIIVYVANENALKVDALVALVAYTNEVPCPGGCNMEFSVEISPFQKLFYDDATVTVDAQPAAVPKIRSKESPCEKYPLHHDAYRMYMPEQDFSNETYFSAIANMLTVRDIERNADLIPAPLFGSAMRRVYSVYPGTGSVYGMVAHFANHSSAYVPIVTYGCDPSSWSNSCTILTTTFSKVLCALSFFMGMFITMRGQYYFKTSMFLIGMVMGGYTGYTVGTLVGTFEFTGIILTAMFVAVMTSLIWLLLWLSLGSPIPSLILSGLTLGSLFFYIFYFSIPVGVIYLEVDAYYWLLFSTFVIFAILIFSVIPLVGNILCFTVLGAYATIISIDYYSGSSLKYIIINGIRRSTISNFKDAVIDPPYQDKDILLTAFWAFLVILGLYKQCATNWNRAPFPPPTPNLVRDDDQEPLLGGRIYRNRPRSFNSQRTQYLSF